MKVKRLCPGEYTVSVGDVSVNISRFYWLEGKCQWVAVATWDHNLATDPLPSLKEAKGEAFKMIMERR